MSDTRTFMAAILRRPKQLGAIAPSSKALAKRAVVPVPTAGSPVVVELGPGGGVITDEIWSRLPDGGRLIAVEHSGEMVRHLRDTRPWLHVIHGDAMRLIDLMHAEGVRQADVIVSTLPWTLFDDDAQILMLRQITALLAPGGTFCTVITVPALPFRSSRRFRQRLDAAFAQVGATRPVWGNIPPALLYVCERPRDLSANGINGANGVNGANAAGEANGVAGVNGGERRGERGGEAGQAGSSTAGADRPGGHE